MSDSTSNLPSINMISEGSLIKGTLHTKSDFRLAGSLDGKLNVEGKCIISASARIKGDLVASEADIAGRIDGELVISNKLILRKTAIITGDIHTKVLLVEEGARFEGACKMSTNPMDKLRKNATNSEMKLSSTVEAS